jgi:hypothetical protein
VAAEVELSRDRDSEAPQLLLPRLLHGSGNILVIDRHGRRHVPTLSMRQGAATMRQERSLGRPHDRLVLQSIFDTANMTSHSLAALYS